jgi:Tfp pilus assembly protein FimT
MLSRRETGLSVLEIAVILLVIGAISAIALPNIYTASRSYTLKIAADRIAQQLNLCRQKALVANRTRLIQIDPATGLAIVDTNDNTQFGDSGGSGVPADDPAEYVDLTGITVTSQDNPIVRGFTSRGEVPIGHSSLPTVQDITVRYRSKQRTITIEPRGAIVVGPES